MSLQMATVTCCYVASRDDWLYWLTAAAVMGDTTKMFHLIMFHSEHRLCRSIDVGDNADVWTALRGDLDKLMTRRSGRKVMKTLSDLLNAHAKANIVAAKKDGDAEKFTYFADLADRFFCFNPDILFFKGV